MSEVYAWIYDSIVFYSDDWGEVPLDVLHGEGPSEECARIDLINRIKEEKRTLIKRKT